MIKDLSSSLSSTFLDVLASLGSILESDSVNNVFEAFIGSQHLYSTFVFHLNSHHVLTSGWILGLLLEHLRWLCVDLAMIITNQNWNNIFALQFCVHKQYTLKYSVFLCMVDGTR